MIRFLSVAVLVALPTLAQAQMQAGEWQINVNVTSFDMPSASPEQADAFKKPRVHKECFTTEQVQGGLLEMMKKAQKSGECKMTSENASGTRFDAVMVCDRPDGAKVTVTLNGSFAATRFDINTAVEQTGAKAMKMTAVTAAERIGDCKQ